MTTVTARKSAKSKSNKNSKGTSAAAFMAGYSSGARTPITGAVHTEERIFKHAAPKSAPAVIDAHAENDNEPPPAAAALAHPAQSVTIVSEPASVQPPSVHFTKRDMRDGGQVMDCHKQWRDRPADEAVYSLDDLVSRTNKLRAESSEVEFPWADLRVDACDGELFLAGASLNNYALGQLCRLPTRDTAAEVTSETPAWLAARMSGSVAPLDFVTKLRPETAAQILNERLHDAPIARKSNANLLVTNGVARSIMTEKYERTWYSEGAECIANLCERGGWGPAQAFRTSAGTASQAWGPTDKPLPLGWVGDRSMFVCLVDYDGAVTHQGNDYARFCLYSDSEVGAAKRRITFGLMDFACCNFILWGCHEVWDAEFIHTGSIRESWAEITAGLSKQLESDTRADIITGIDTARSVLLGETKERALAVTQAHTRLPKSLVVDAYNRAEGTPRYGDPRSVWGMLNGLTEASQVVAQTADARTRIDTAAASLMNLLGN